jgi:hypothetical protein
MSLFLPWLAGYDILPAFVICDLFLLLYVHADVLILLLLYDVLSLIDGLCNWGSTVKLS